MPASVGSRDSNSFHCGTVIRMIAARCSSVRWFEAGIILPLLT
jgi:hypothetical protein